MTSTSLLDPKLDVVFKMLMLRSDRLLGSMLEAALGQAIATFEVLDRSLPGDAPPDKAIVVDLLVELGDGRRINVEMQVRTTRELKPRLAFYAARNLTEQLSRGESYVQLRSSVVVAWLVEPLLRDLDRFHSIFELHERHTHFRYGDELTLHLLQLSNLAATPRPREPYEQQLLLWGRFLSAKSRLELQRLKEQDTIMAEAVDTLEHLSQDPEAQRAARKRLEDAKFLQMRDALNREDGRQEGITIGEATGKARALLDFLQARQIATTDADRARILGITDVTQLDSMVRKAATVSSVAELFR